MGLYSKGKVDGLILMGALGLAIGLSQFGKAFVNGLCQMGLRTRFIGDGH